MSEAFSTNIRPLSTSLNEVNPNPNSLDTNLVRQVVNSSSAPIVGQETLLYDGSSNQKIQDTPWFDYQQTVSILQQGSETVSVVGNTTQLETDQAAYAGFINYGVNVNILQQGIELNPNPNFPILNPTDGFIVSFTAELLSHSAL